MGLLEEMMEIERGGGTPPPEPPGGLWAEMRALEAQQSRPQPKQSERPRPEYMADWTAQQGFEAGLAGPVQPEMISSLAKFMERFKYADFKETEYRKPRYMQEGKPVSLWDLYQQAHAEGVKPENRGPYQKAQEYVRFHMPWERQAIVEDVRKHATEHGLDVEKQVEKFQRFVFQATPKKDRGGLGIAAQALGMGIENTYESISGFVQGTVPELMGQVYRYGPGSLKLAGEAVKDVAAGKWPGRALSAEGAAEVNANAKQVADAVRQGMMADPDAHVAHVQALQMMHAKDPRFQGRQGLLGWVEDAIYGAAQMAPAWGTSMAMTAAGGGGIAPVAFWTMIEGGGAYQQFREGKIPHEDAALAAPIVGLFNGVLEVMQIQGAMPSRILKNMQKEVAKSGARGALAVLGRKTLSFVKDYGQELIVEEGLQATSTGTVGKLLAEGAKARGHDVIPQEWHEVYDAAVNDTAQATLPLLVMMGPGAVHGSFKSGIVAYAEGLIAEHRRDVEAIAAIDKPSRAAFEKAVGKKKAKRFPRQIDREQAVAKAKAAVAAGETAPPAAPIAEAPQYSAERMFPDTAPAIQEPADAVQAQAQPVEAQPEGEAQGAPAAPAQEVAPEVIDELAEMSHQQMSARYKLGELRAIAAQLGVDSSGTQVELMNRIGHRAFEMREDMGQPAAQPAEQAPPQTADARLKQLDDALAAGEIEQETHQLASYMATTMEPNTPIETILELANETMRAAEDEIGDFQYGREGQRILGRTRSVVSEGITKALISLYQGHDAHTFAHEWGHAHIRAVLAAAEVDPSAKALVESLRKHYTKKGVEKGKEADPDGPLREAFVRDFADALMRDKPHETGRLHRINRTIRRAVARVVESLRRLFKSDYAAVRAIIRAGFDPKAALKLFAGSKDARLGSAAAATEMELAPDLAPFQREVGQFLVELTQDRKGVLALTVAKRAVMHFRRLHKRSPRAAELDTLFDDVIGRMYVESDRFLQTPHGAREMARSSRWIGDRGGDTQDAVRLFLLGLPRGHGKPGTKGVLDTVLYDRLVEERLAGVHRRGKPYKGTLPEAPSPKLAQSMKRYEQAERSARSLQEPVGEEGEGELGQFLTTAAGRPTEDTQQQATWEARGRYGMPSGKARQRRAVEDLTYALVLDPEISDLNAKQRSGILDLITEANRRGIPVHSFVFEKSDQESQEAITEAWDAALRRLVPHASRRGPATLMAGAVTEYEMAPPTSDASTVLGPWLADMAEAKMLAQTDAMRLERQLSDTVGRKDMKWWQRAMFLWIDLRNAQERGFGTPQEQWDKHEAGFTDEEGNHKDTLLTDVHRDLLEASQNMPPAVQAIADELLEINRVAGEVAQQHGIIGEPFKNYVARMWQFGGQGAGIFSSGNWHTRTKRALPRSLESALEGWGKGYDLAVNGAINAMLVARTDVAEAIYNRRLIEQGLKEGIFSTNPSTQTTLGYAKVDVPGFHKYKWTGTTVSKLAEVKTLDELRDMPSHSGRDAEELLGIQRARVRKILGLPADAALPMELEAAGLNTAIGIARASKGKVYGKGAVFEGEAGDIFKAVPLYAEADLARRLSSVFAGKMSMYAFGRWVSKWNAILKSNILMTSLFHHAAFLRSYLLGGRPGIGGLLDIGRGVAGAAHGLAVAGPAGLIEGARQEGVKGVAKGVLATPIKAMEQFFTWQKSYQDGQAAVEAFGPELKMLVRGGLTIGLQQEWDEQAFQAGNTIVGRIIDRIPGGSAVKGALLELRQRQANWLFGKLGANMKVQASLLEYRYQVKKNQAQIANGTLTVEEIAQAVARLMNDDFGGLNLERLTLESPLGRWHGPFAQRTKRLLMLAPDWTESNVRTMVKAFQRGLEGQVYRAFWARAITKGALATLAFNLLAGAWDDDDFVERFKKTWKAGNLRWLDVDVTTVANAMRKMVGAPVESGSRTYFRLIGHFVDPVKFVVHPLRSLKHKGSVLMRQAYDALSGTDWRGARFTTWRELLGMDYEKGRYTTSRRGKYRARQPKWGKLAGKATTFQEGPKGPLEYGQVPSYLRHEAEGVLPIQVQNFIRFVTGELDAIDAASGALGLPTRTIPAKRFDKD